MSWAQAQREAEKWLAAAGVPSENIKGKYFDLREYSSLIVQEGQFRTMVLRAADRILKKRGATAWLPD